MNNSNLALMIVLLHIITAINLFVSIAYKEKQHNVLVIQLYIINCTTPIIRIDLKAKYR